MSRIIATHSMKVLKSISSTNEWGQEVAGNKEIYNNIICHLSQVMNSEPGDVSPFATENKHFKLFYPIEFNVPVGARLELTPLFQGGEHYILLAQPSVAYQISQKKEMKVSLWQE